MQKMSHCKILCIGSFDSISHLPLHGQLMSFMAIVILPCVGRWRGTRSGANMIVLILFLTAMPFGVIL